MSKKQLLGLVWGIWLLYRLIGVSALTVFLTNAQILPSVLWQVLVLLPALCLTGVVIKAQSAYLLIVASFVGLIYLASVGVFFVIHLYENAPLVSLLGVGVETLLLLTINILLMMVIKALPPMHKTRQETP